MTEASKTAIIFGVATMLCVGAWLYAIGRIPWGDPDVRQMMGTTPPEKVFLSGWEFRPSCPNGWSYVRPIGDAGVLCAPKGGDGRKQ